MNIANTKKVLVVAGGTGGHIFPALAVAQTLKKDNVIVEWLGSKQGMENNIVPKNNIKLNTISIVGLRGKKISHILKAMFLILLSTWQTLVVFYKFKPTVVLAMGGYVSGIAGIMAKIFSIPLVIQEQNAVVGSTNKILSKLTKHVFQAFDNTIENAMTSGNPITFISQKKEQHTGLNVLVVGGSLGAKIINETVDGLELNPTLNINIWHQTGKIHFNKNATTPLKKVAFIEDMAQAYAWADIVICRAGAMTISELMLSSTASILIPLPQAIDNHQLLNAKILEKIYGTIILEQKNLTPQSLGLLLENHCTEDGLITLRKMAENAHKLAKPQATYLIADYIKNLS
jgi:UDP-N-acetylglucosamine--N-acetylmuramyl-(pentapeptide) pyrophosphoryl-undecaprenol N-acetylglucosamine transferase